MMASSRKGRPSSPGSQVSRCAELLAVAVCAGASLHQAVDAVAAQTDSELDQVASATSNGESLLDSLGHLGESAPGWRSLAMLLSSGIESGASMVDSLRRLGESERTRERRRLERQIRRLPVLLLIPTAVGVLPAFVLLTIVPLLLASAENLR